ncbi:MAG: hypothetical protein JRI91_08020 [Deltaproteobacteria bacterium]|nr:hypothetical protein [Deltaproteobacteria bacterium]
MKKRNENWKPLAENNLKDIRQMFNLILPDKEYGDLAETISDYWVKMLKNVWKNKADAIKEKDLKFKPSDPLSRIQQKTVVISYADSVTEKGEKSLVTLDNFLGKYFPAVRGMHMLPACEVAEDRFNDGFFSQVVRDQIHGAFGTNQKFSEMMEKYYSMADFVLNHVDINNPMFQAYLNGDDDKDVEKKDCFYIYTEEEYQDHCTQGDFSQIFRPRPFPLFSIFRKKPEDEKYKNLGHAEKVIEMQACFKHNDLPEPVISLLSIFNKIKNDQMLLAEDYCHIVNFRDYLKNNTDIDPDTIFTTSAIQEIKSIPYIFHDRIKSMEDFLEAVGYIKDSALEYASNYRQFDNNIFGEEIRALTTFSHVQVDLNTSTFQGLKMLADDFSWYLSLDLDMLRLDAANFAFKKWKTTCFGLPEVSSLMKILYLSIDSVSPRIVANLEVNDQLGSILSQMADKNAPPPMMYDFHLAGILPVVFNTGNAEILLRIFKKIAGYDIPKESIRFSLAESHDGKSVRGSLDILTLAERQVLADTVEQNKGRVKYKGVPERQSAVAEFKEVCNGANIDFENSKKRLFKQGDPSDTTLYLDESIRNESDIAGALDISMDDLTGNDTLRFFINKVLHGREPYELCVSTRDSMIEIENNELEAERYLAFYTLAFALMGRNVKSIYFNDLMGLPNDYEKFEESGELRDLKRTKSDYQKLENLSKDNTSIQYRIAKGINNIIALVDSDPALNFRGNEAEARLPSGDNPSKSVAVIHTFYQNHHTLIVVNIGQRAEEITIDLDRFNLSDRQSLFDNINGQKIMSGADGKLAMTLQPYQRLWISRESIEIPQEMLLKN